MKGVFGGSFNPPHKEHIDICLDSLTQLGLDEIILLPCGNAPHKKELLPFDVRCKLLELSLPCNSHFIIDDIENRLDGVTNSARVLPLLKEKYGDILFIIGGDSLRDMHTWIEPEKVMTFPIAVANREGVDFRKVLEAKAYYESKVGANITFLERVYPKVSSTLIRTKLALGIKPDEITESALEYIEANFLYKYRSDMVSEVKSRLTPQRFEHTRQVVLMAVKLNESLKLDYDKVFVSSLLHDVAKYSTKVHNTVPEEYSHGGYAHAFFGAEEAETDFGITDSEIINAIRYHTTGRAKMSKLEQLIYVADYIEETRTHHCAKEAREIALANFDEGFKYIIKSMHDYLGEGEDICPLTAECYNYYVKGDNA